MMKIKLLFFVIVLSYFLYSCGNGKKETDESEIISNNRITLKINGDINNLLQIDSIFTDIKTIPLETKDECMIEEIVKAIFYDNKLFLQDNMKRLLVFNTNGKFLYEIGKIGRGPGEFLDIRDFDIDKEGNIYIHSYLKILKYKNDGTFLKRFSYRFAPTDEFYCIPFQFAVKSNGNFYIWGGSSGIEYLPDKKFFAMYEMTKDGVIINKYFPVKYNIAGNYHQLIFIGI